MLCSYNSHWCTISWSLWLARFCAASSMSHSIHCASERALLDLRCSLIALDCCESWYWRQMISSSAYASRFVGLNLMLFLNLATRALSLEESRSLGKGRSVIDEVFSRCGRLCASIDRSDHCSDYMQVCIADSKRGLALLDCIHLILKVCSHWFVQLVYQGIPLRSRVPGRRRVGRMENLLIWDPRVSTQCFTMLLVQNY